MATTKRRGTKRTTRTPRKPKQPKIKEAGSLTPEQHLRHSVFALIHQPGQAAKVTVAEAEIALAFVLDNEKAPASMPLYEHPKLEKFPAHEELVAAKRSKIAESASDVPVINELPHRKHFDVDRIDM